MTYWQYSQKIWYIDNTHKIYGDNIHTKIWYDTTYTKGRIICYLIDFVKDLFHKSKPFDWVIEKLVFTLELASQV